MPREYSLENTRNIGIMAHTSTLERPQRQREFCSTQDAFTKLARCMKALQQWTGWSRSKKGVSQLPLLQRRHIGNVTAF